MTDGIVQRGSTGAWQPKGPDGQYKPDEKRTGIQEVHAADGAHNLEAGGVQTVDLEPAGQPKVETIGGPTASPAPVDMTEAPEGAEA